MTTQPEERCSTCLELGTDRQPERVWDSRAEMYRAQTVHVYCPKCLANIRADASR